MKRNLKLDWKIRLLDRILLHLNQPIPQMSLEELHQLPEAHTPFLIERLLGGKRIPIPQVTDQRIEGRHGEVPIRMYRPSDKQNLPLILFFHGGGLVGGNLQTYDLMCRRIASSTGAIVIAVGYRLAPWFKYPVGLEDCYDAFLWVAKNIENLGARQQLLVIGDSAGGNLAASVCLLARDQGQSGIARQILLYPVVDATLSQPSIERYADAPVLTKDMMECYVKYYAHSDVDRLKPYFSPLLTETLSHLPPALIITAEYDPLHDEGLMYAQRLREAGNQVQVHDYSGMVHGFLSFPPFCRDALPAFAKIAAYVGELGNSSV